MNTETAEWEETVKTRADELTALAESVKVLNDDDALKLFKKTLPSAASFIQVGETAAAEPRQRISETRCKERLQTGLHWPITSWKADGICKSHQDDR